ncbi:retrovirus-related pol polyprotein from transposon TNT 1-94 [Tanacetum coccineum]|uniref:Retrovirus-related pol polyprotein from transposon TNT 1-94 n=1 Tax=Tanacetum coccineum TaxID=301880 RepID=A0ABQ4XUI5_9ASTR
MESLNSNSKEREMQLTQRLVKQRHSHCMAWFEQLETHLRDLYLNSSSHAVDAFKPAFHSFFGEEHQTFRLKMFHNLDQLRLQLEKENLLEINPRTCLEALRTQFKDFFLPQTGRDLLKTLDTLKAVIYKAVITYGRLQLQSQDVQINPVQAVDDRLIVSKSSGIESENTNALSKSVNGTQLQQHESLVTESTTLEVNLNTDIKALDVGSVITESSRTKSDKHDTSSSSGTYIIHAVDADIRPVNDQVPFTEVQLTAQHNVLANEQQHTEQSEPMYDTYLSEKVDSNTTPDSTNMCHRGGEIDQDAEQYQAKSPLLKAEFLKTNDMVEKEVFNELSNRFLQLEKHCISLEISMQQKEESFQSNKPCKNQDAPEFCEFFEINDLKAQLQAKTTLICNLKNQIKSVKEASNEAKVKHDIDVLETINIELESSVTKLLAENEKLNKENDKTVENADLKAQIQEKVFANVALKNELRKLKGNSMDTKFRLVPQPLSPKLMFHQQRMLSKASKNKSWLWHRRLNHLNFGTINDLARKDLVRGLPRLKFEKDHLCSACQLGKSKKHTHKPKTDNTNLEVLNTLHMDLCGPMRVQTINGKKYILVIVDDYSRFTWVKFLRSKDETPAVVIKFLKQIQVGLNKTVRFIRTDNGTEFVNKTLYDYYENVGCGLNYQIMASLTIASLYTVTTRVS